MLSNTKEAKDRLSASSKKHFSSSSPYFLPYFAQPFAKFRLRPTRSNRFVYMEEMDSGRNINFTTPKSAGWAKIFDFFPWFAKIRSLSFAPKKEFWFQIKLANYHLRFWTLIFAPKILLKSGFPCGKWIFLPKYFFLFFLDFC